MTDKTEAPERMPETLIAWLSPVDKEPRRFWTCGVVNTPTKAKYTRTDLHQAEIAKAWNEAIEAVRSHRYEGKHGFVVTDDDIRALKRETKLVWQPIETAPRDGTVILIFRDRKGIEEVYPARWAYSLDPEYPWQILCEEHGDNALPDDGYITSWRPLPKPPKEIDQ